MARTYWIGLAAPLALAGCGGGSPKAGNEVAVASPTVSTVVAPLPPPAGPVEAPSSGTAVTDGWIGKWVGVEGLALTVARGDRPGTYRLHIALMDGSSDHIGTAVGDTIRFERDGKAETIRATTGAETGLKWLAEKKTCLTIRAGEGFCRD